MRKIGYFFDFEDLINVKNCLSETIVYISEQEEDFDVLPICEIFDKKINFCYSESRLEERQIIADFLKVIKERVIKEDSKEGIMNVVSISFKEMLEMIFNLYDLTEIEASDWNSFFSFSIPISYLEELNLAQTGINFYLDAIGIRRSSDGKRVRINCNGCNVMFDNPLWGNAPHYSYYEINEELFDENTRRKNPQIFLSNIFSKEFKDKYYSRIVDIKDIIELSEEQIDELSQKEFIKYFYHPDENNNLFLFLIKFMDLRNVLEFYNNYKEDYQYLEALLNNERIASWMGMYFSNNKLQFENGLSKIKLSINNYLIECIETNKCHYDSNRIDFQRTVGDDVISKECFYLDKFEGKLKRCRKNHYIEYFMKLDEKRRFNTCYPSDFPKEFVDFNKDLFLLDIDIPNEISQRYYERKLTKEDVKLLETLSKVDTYYFVEGWEQQVIDDELVSYFGKEILEEKNKKYKKIIEFLRRHEEMYSYFKMYFNFERSKCGNIGDLFTKEKFQYLLKMVFYTDCDKNLFKVVFDENKHENETFCSLKPEFQDIFGWLEFKTRSGYQSFEDMNEPDDTLVINETFFPNYLVMWFGYDNFSRFCKETNFFTPENTKWYWGGVTYWMRVFSMRIYEFKNSNDELLKLGENEAKLSMELKKMGRTALVKIEEAKTYEEFIEYLCKIYKKSPKVQYYFKKEFERLFNHLQITDVSNPKIK